MRLLGERYKNINISTETAVNITSGFDDERDGVLVCVYSETSSDLVLISDVENDIIVGSPLYVLSVGTYEIDIFDRDLYAVGVGTTPSVTAIAYKR